MDFKDKDNNVILTQTEGLTMGKPSSPKYARNKNILVIGGSGSGKTRFFVKPNLMQMHSSYIVTDPKGTVLIECGKMLERGRPVRDEKGNVSYQPYRIKVFNTIDFGKSMHYNPFAYISKNNREKDILKFVDVLIKNTQSSQQNGGDDFWVKQYGTTKLHDFFFAQTLDKVKEGGIVAFVTSKGTLDKKDESFRIQLAEKADLIGAIRLPNNAFKANAGTEVTSDIIFLQKRSAPPEELPDWVHLGKTEDGLRVNSYFAENPEMVLGTIVEGNKLYGRNDDTMCIPIEGADLRQQIHEAVQKLNARISQVKTNAVFQFSDK